MVEVVTNEKDKVCTLGHCSSHGHQAWWLLRLAFTIIPIVAGLDKFFGLAAQWEQYLSPQFNVLGEVRHTMMVIGVIEILVGIGVWFLPRIFSYIVALWLLLLIINFLMLGNFYAIALRDFGLLLAALALARLSCKHGHTCCSNPEHKH